MATQIQLRRDTAAAWTAANPVLASGEIGIETDTVVDAGGARIVKCKIGDGTLAWNAIPFTLLGLPLTVENIEGLDTELAKKADLVDGLIPAEQIPSIAITDYLGKVDDEAEMLTLSGERGDWCIRQDEGIPYVIVGNDPSSLLSWMALLTPSNPVITVNGKSGPTVVIGISDIDTLQTILDGKAAASHTHSASAVTNDSTVPGTTVNDALEHLHNKTYTEILRAGATIPTLASRWLVPGLSGFGTSAIVNVAERAIHKGIRIMTGGAQPGTGSLTCTRDFTSPTGTLLQSDVLTIPAGSAVGVYSMSVDFDATAIDCNVKFTFFNNATSSSAFVQGMERSICK